MSRLQIFHIGLFRRDCAVPLCDSELKALKLWEMLGLGISVVGFGFHICQCILTCKLSFDGMGVDSEVVSMLMPSIVPGSWARSLTFTARFNFCFWQPVLNSESTACYNKETVTPDDPTPWLYIDLTCPHFLQDLSQTWAVWILLSLRLWLLTNVRNNLKYENPLVFTWTNTHLSPLQLKTFSIYPCFAFYKRCC